MLKWNVVKVEDWQLNLQTFFHTSPYYRFPLYSLRCRCLNGVKILDSPPMLKLHLLVNKQELRNYYAARKITSLSKTEGKWNWPKEEMVEGRKGGKCLYKRRQKLGHRIQSPGLALSLRHLCGNIGHIRLYI